MPKVTVIIPCYNAAASLRETAATVLEQTMKDFELICVNDGSTDETLTVLDDLAAQDARVQVVSQENAGEGAARDAGLAHATGQWIYCLDADDLVEPQLLEHAVARGEETSADIVIFRTEELDARTGERRPFAGCFDIEWLGELSDNTFNPYEHPERILNSFQNWVHNKLFSREFVERQGLSFQHLHRNADILFTCRALTEATRIALLDETLHHYRVNNPQSALFTTDLWPLEFLDAFVALREALEVAGTWELYHDSYVNWAQEAAAMNLWRARSLDAFRTIATTLREYGLAQLDILGFPEEKAFSPLRHEQCAAIAQMPVDELLFYYLSLEKRHLVDIQTELSQCRLNVQGRLADIAALENSASFKIGRTITAAPRALRDRIR